MINSLVCRMNMVMRTMLPRVSMAVHQAILLMDVRVLVFMQMFMRVRVDVSMRVLHSAMAMPVFMIMAVLVRMKMPVLVVAFHLTPSRHRNTRQGPRTGELR